MPRLFVAVWPPDDVCARLRLLSHEGWGDVRWMPEANWHVTLAFLGDAHVDETTEALRGTVLPGATAEVSSHLRAVGRTSLVLPVSGVDELASVVQAATLPDAADRPFRGHITMARSRGGRPMKGRPAPAPWEAISFRVDEVALVASTVDPQGSTYATLATFSTTDSCERSRDDRP
jgi:2'-5' RNA ligase